jgi:propanol-preferring alcohol dehydrogenase
MKAMRLRAPRPVEEEPLALEQVPPPEPSRGEVLIQVTACGVCHTDLHTVEGDLALPRLPLIPGHQVIGRVVKSGSGATRFAEGDRVGVTWFHASCGACTFCREQRENLCLSARFTGLHADGGYAEFMVVPEDSAFPVPEVFSDAEATPLLCGGVIGYRAMRLSTIQPEGRLGLYGFGNSAHIVIQLAVHMGCRVYVFTRSKKHQELATHLGAVWVGTAEEKAPEPMDASIIFAPAGALVPAALGALERGGTLALAGITMTPIPQMDYELIYGERTVRSVANTTRKDAEELLRLAGEIPVRSVVETFPLEEANRVLLMMKQSALRAGAALLMEE